METHRTRFGRSLDILAKINFRQIGFELVFVINIKLKCRFVDGPVILPEQRDMIQGNYRQIDKLPQLRPVRLKSCDDFALELPPVPLLLRHKVRTDELAQLPAEIYINIFTIQLAGSDFLHESMIVFCANSFTPRIGCIFLRIIPVLFENIAIIRIPRVADLDALVEALRGQPAGQTHEQIVLQRIPGVMQIRDLQSETLADKSL